MAVSLDGFIADASGGVDWLDRYAPPDEDHGFEAFIADIDGIVMGRRSFETVLGFGTWPYERPVLVASRSMTDADLPTGYRRRAHVTSLPPGVLMDALGDHGWTRVYVDGGALVRSFLREGLIADMTLTVIPVLLGAGRPLFGALPRETALVREGTTTHASGLVTLRYRVT